MNQVRYHYCMDCDELVERPHAKIHVIVPHRRAAEMDPQEALASVRSLYRRS